MQRSFAPPDSRRRLSLPEPWLYDILVQLLAERVLSHIRRQELLRPGERVGVAVSGGIDSVALLQLLLELRGELGIVLSVVHFNHKLRGAESDGDQAFVMELAREHNLEIHCGSADVTQYAAEEHVSIETAAHELRYRFFRQLLGAEWDQRRGARQEVKNPLTPFNPILYLNKIVTGHTLDDQAETVLQRIIRGAGLRGLAGIHPRIVIEDMDDDDGERCGEVVRPLLTTRRRELQEYLQDLRQPWREDATNLDIKFFRNRVRSLVVPLLEKEFNPSIAENLSELAEIARGEEDFWETEVAGWMGTGVHWSEPAWRRKIQLVQIEATGSTGQSGSTGSDLESTINSAPWLVMNAAVDRLWLLGEPLAVQRRIIKAVGDEAGVPLEFKHVQEVLRFVTQEEESGGEISLPLGWKLSREPDQIVFVTPDLRASAPAERYEYELSVPGEVRISEIGSTLEARRIRTAAGYNPEHLLDGNLLVTSLTVRNWRPGDRFRPNHTKAAKKVKELLHDAHVPQPERGLWPVVLAGEEIVWMRGFPPAAGFVAKLPGEAIVILERPTGSEK